jgi:hypothetical protein
MNLYVTIFYSSQYLIYTNEVLRHHNPSHPLFCFCLHYGFITYFIVQKIKNYIENIPSYIQKIKISGIYLFWPLLFHHLLRKKTREMYL